MRTWKSCADEGIALYRCCQLFKAEELFVESLRRVRDENGQPEHLAEALNNLAIGYIARAKFQDALAVLKDASSALPRPALQNPDCRLQSALASLLRIQIHLEQARFEAVRIEAPATLADIESDLAFCAAEFWMCMARAHMGLGQLDEADQAIERFIATADKASHERFEIYHDAISTFSMFGPSWTLEPATQDKALTKCRSSVRALLFRANLRSSLPERSRAMVDEALKFCTTLGEHFLTAQTYLAASRLALQESNWASADEYSRLSLDLAERIFGPAHPYLSSYLLNSVSIKLMSVGLSDCLDVMERTFEIADKAFGRRHPAFARTQLFWCGMLPFIDAENENILESQEQLIKEALETFLDHFDDTHSLVLASKVQLAEILVRSNQIEAAYNLLIQAIEAATTISANDPFALVGCVNEIVKLSDLLEDSRRYDIWEFAHSLLDDIDLESLETSRRIDLMRNLAFLYQKVGDKAQPELMLRYCLELSETLDADLHRRCRQDLVKFFIDTNELQAALDYARSDEDSKIHDRLKDDFQVAKIYRAMNKNAEAERLAACGLSQAEQVLPDCADCFLQFIGLLADLYIEQNRLEEAVRMIGLLAIHKDELGASAQDAMPHSLRIVGEAFARQNDQRAEKFFVESLAAAEELRGKAPETLDSCLIAFAEYSLMIGHTEKARKLYMRSLKLREELLGERSYATAMAMFNVAELSIDLDLDLALNLSRKVIEILEDDEDVSQEYFIAALRLRAAILERAQKIAEARHLFERARQLEARKKKDEDKTDDY